MKVSRGLSMANGSKEEQRAKLRGALLLAAQRSNLGLWVGRVVEWCEGNGAIFSFTYEAGVFTVRVVPLPPENPVQASDPNPTRALAAVARRL
jgi:hypothetical protein